MPNVPGLTSMNDDGAPANRRLGGRVQVDTRIPEEQLRPSATPVNTFARPTDGGLMKLGEGLAALNPKILELGIGVMQNHEQKAGDREAVVTAQFAGDPEGLRAAIASDPELKGTMAGRHGEAVAGQGVADKLAAAMKEDYATNFDKVAGNFDEFIQGHVKGALGDNPSGPAAHGFMTRMGPAISELRTQYAKDHAEGVVKAQNDQIYGSFNATLNASLDANATPEATHKALRQTMETNALLAHKTPEEQNALLVQNLGRRLESMKDAKFEDVEKTYRLIKGVLTTPTTDDRTGQVKSLRDDTAVGAQAAQVLAHAEDLYASREHVEMTGATARLHELARRGDPSFHDELRKFNEAHPRWTSPAWSEGMTYQFEEAKRRADVELAKRQAQVAEDRQKNSVIAFDVLPALQNGTGHVLTDKTYLAKDGTQAVMSVKDQLDEGVKTAQRMIDEQYKGKPPEAKLAAEANLYGPNPVKNEAWERTLKGGRTAASTVVANGGQLPPMLADAYKLYKDLSAQSPGLVQKHVDRDTARFYEVARIAQDAKIAPDDNSALALAARVEHDATFRADTSGTSKRDIDDKTRIALRGGLFGTNWVGSSNGDAVAAEAAELAHILHRGMGLNIDEAVKQAVASVPKNYVKINGNAVRIGDKAVPGNFEELANQYVRSFYDQNKDKLKAQGISPGDLTIQAVNGTPNWTIFGANGTMLPFMLKGRTFTPASLATVQQGNTLAAEGAARDALAHRYDPTFQLGPISVGPLFPGGMTKAQEAEVAAARDRVNSDQTAADTAILTKSKPAPRGLPENRRPAGPDTLPRKPRS